MDEFPTDGLIEALGEYSSNPTHGGWRQTAVRFEGKELVDVTDGELREFLPSKGRQDMHSHNRLIVAKGARRNLVAHYIVEPSFEEFGDVDAVLFQKLTVVDLPAKFLQLLDDFRPFL